jgi:peptidoglycan/LPS O-acetylase OafA/YrhL
MPSLRLSSDVPHFRSLDGLRGIAACIVMMSHLEWNNHLSNLRFVINGYLAVDLFFILSGLVIAANYGSRIRGAGPAVRFMGLRFFRLYPLHLAVLGMFFVVECFKWGTQRFTGISSEHPPFSGGQSIATLAANVLMVQGLGWIRHPGWNGPSWSISCEFFAYLAFALLCPLGFVRRTWAAVAAICLSAGTYAFLVTTRGNLDVVFDLGILRCFAGFACGVLLWKYRAALDGLRLTRWRYSQILVACALIAVIAVARGPAVAATIPGFVLLIICVKSDQGLVARVLNTRGIQYLGRISYSIYMVHELVVIGVLMMLKRHAAMTWNPTLGRNTAAVNPWRGDALLVAVAAGVLVLATITYKAIEEPGRSFGRRLLGSGKSLNQARPRRISYGEKVTETICREYR